MPQVAFSQQQLVLADWPGNPRIAGARLTRPFLKWAGGKSKLVSELLHHAPRKFQTYYEPFVGGGAMYFALADTGLIGPAQESVLNDINLDLIAGYRAVRSRPKPLIELLKRHKELHTEEYFYSVRNQDRTPEFPRMSSLERAARLIYLNKTCYNGLYRVNSRGHFNVPFGEYANPPIVDEKNIMACSRALAGAEFKNSSFERVVKPAGEGDFVYFDPPYVPLSKTAHFTGYAKNGFTLDLQLRLKDLCEELDRRGVKFMLSNSQTELVSDMYKKFKKTTVVVEASRAINSNASRRGKIQELLIKNY